MRSISDPVIISTSSLCGLQPDNINTRRFNNVSIQLDTIDVRFPWPQKMSCNIQSHAINPIHLKIEKLQETYNKFENQMFIQCSLSVVLKSHSKAMDLAGVQVLLLCGRPLTSTTFFSNVT